MSAQHDLSGLNVVVTGAASGIGKQIARDLFWQERCSLHLVDQDHAGLEVLRDELSPGAPRGARDAARRASSEPAIKLYRCDISSRASLNRFAGKIAREPVDILINNAGVFYLGLFEKMKINDFEKVLNVNLFGTIRMTRILLPKLLESERAYIVNVASLAGLMGAPGMSAYATSKFGVVGFSDALAVELEGRVGVCSICPTFVKTDIAKNALLDQAIVGEKRTDRVRAMESILSILGSKPWKASQAVINAVKQKRKFVLVNADAYFFYYLNRFFPRLSNSLVAKAYQKILQRGMMDS